MKDKKQINSAEEMIKILQDYIELAKVERKIKLEEHSVSEIIEDIVVELKEKVEEL